jgi:hypothetical protein
LGRLFPAQAILLVLTFGALARDVTYGQVISGLPGNLPEGHCRIIPESENQGRKVEGYYAKAPGRSWSPNPGAFKGLGKSASIYF